jgi:hypothetical protein
MIAQCFASIAFDISPAGAKKIIASIPTLSLGLTPTVTPVGLAAER